MTEMASHILPTYPRSGVTPARGEGVYLIDEQDRRYLDFTSGIAVNALGHAHPHLVRAVQDQASKLWHVSNLFNIPGQEQLASRICGASFAEYVFFCNSGAEALEAAIKMARRYHFVKGNPERNRIITFTGAFHGRTLATIAAGGQEKYLEGFEPRLPGFDQVAFGDHEALKQAITHETAAVLVEPVQGEGGVRAVPSFCLTGLRELCDEHGILLIADEVQCGIMRTGKFLAHQHAGMAPDIATIAKGIGGGFPLGACLATKEAASGMAFGSHGSTFGGNPLAMAVGNALLDVVLDPSFFEHVDHVATYLEDGLKKLALRHQEKIIELRGAGLMRGIKLADHVVARDVLHACAEESLLVCTAADNVLRLLPPLIIEPSHVDEALHVIDGVIARA
ncbi:MAG TPA: acetylornithine transaminase [Alphaproteobacteria bacterium]|mgnify:FL=1|nr:MAG: aspartate aminotransferase family protein [SAR116 cluster bacterium]HCY48048.1 acetylornithine transaminase [Alphaproteobacteria bacterium]